MGVPLIEGNFVVLDEENERTLPVARGLCLSLGWVKLPPPPPPCCCVSLLGTAFIQLSQHHCTSYSPHNSDGALSVFVSTSQSFSRLQKERIASCCIKPKVVLHGTAHHVLEKEALGNRVAVWMVAVQIT